MYRLRHTRKDCSPARPRRPSRRAGLACLLLAMLATAGCAKRFVNEPLILRDGQAGYRYESQTPLQKSEEVMVILTFSGGGMRAASLAYGILEELARTEIVIGGARRRLLDEIDIISSVSGGSVTSAYFALFGERIFEDFEEKFLKHNVHGKLARKLFSPLAWRRMWSTHYNRDDVAADYFDKILFQGKTYADIMEQPSAPFIIINASDVSMGARWEFTQDQFDLICSDLSTFPISRAVTASSAVPGAFGSLKVANRSAECGNASPPWVESFLADPDATLRMINDANEALAYAAAGSKYIHLLDGGITDNIGVRSIVDMALRQNRLENRTLLGRSEKIEKLVLVVVDAHVEKPQEFSDEDRIGLFKLLGSTFSIPMNRYSFESLELFHETLTRRAAGIKEARVEQAALSGGVPRPLEIYPIYLQFNNLPSKEDSDFFKTMPTSFNLKPEWVDRLRAMAGDSMADSKYFQRLLEDLSGEVKPQP